mmetsp:Transcript_41270/g.47560  ORF Transcript_41270/g.47560 Transcript_41270/m.47560 type:complete len:206 (-) Transcript_41270:173-790(-)
MEVIAAQISESVRTGQVEDAVDLLAQLMKAKVQLKFSIEEPENSFKESSILENRPLQVDSKRGKNTEADDLNAMLFGNSPDVSPAKTQVSKSRHGCKVVENKDEGEQQDHEVDTSLVAELDSLSSKTSKKAQKIEEDEDDCANCPSCKKMKETKFMHLSISGLERLSKLRDLGFTEDEALEAVKKCNSVQECIDYIESKRKTLAS